MEGNKEMLKALAEYNLQYSDSLKKVIQIVRDSSKKVNINIQEQPDPSLMLNTNPVTLDSSNGNIRFFSIHVKDFKGDVYKANLGLWVIKESSNKFSLIKTNPDLGIQDGRFAEGMRTFIPVSLYASKGTIIYFYVSGYYTNSYGKKKIPFDEICAFDLNDMVSYFLAPEPNRRIRNYLKEKGI